MIALDPLGQALASAQRHCLAELCRRARHARVTNDGGVDRITAVRADGSPISVTVQVDDSAGDIVIDVLDGGHRQIRCSARQARRIIETVIRQLVGGE